MNINIVRMNGGAYKQVLKMALAALRMAALYESYKHTVRNSKLTSILKYI